MSSKAPPKSMVFADIETGGLETSRPIIQIGAIAVDERMATNIPGVWAIGDVTGKRAILLDDMVDTAGTLCGAASMLLKAGAKEVHAYCSHAVLSGPAIDRITQSSLSSLVATDTVPLSEEARSCGKIKTLSIAKLVGEAIMRSYRGDSVNSLFV